MAWFACKPGVSGDRERRGTRRLVVRVGLVVGYFDFRGHERSIKKSKE